MFNGNTMRFFPKERNINSIYINYDVFAERGGGVVTYQFL